VQEAAQASIPPGAEAMDRLGSLVLVRIATEADGIARSEVAVDLAPLVNPRPAAPQWRGTIDRAIEALAGAGLIATADGHLQASETGVEAAARFLAMPGELPRSWERVCDVWLVAKALGWRRVPTKRLAALETAEGLRAAVLAHTYGVPAKALATPARLRAALAATALKSAFGEEIGPGLARKLGQSARVGRLLAAQLLRKPRDFAADRPLLAALAAQSAGAAATDPGALRLAVLRQCFAAAAQPARAKRERRRPAQVREEPAARTSIQETSIQEGLPPAPTAPPPPIQQVPQAAPPRDLAGFASEVRSLAASAAQGWSGDRKAYISHVWRNLRDRRPEWGLSEMEFKDLLAAAHRSGQLALANADLKDQSNIRDVQESAVIYKNAVFHFIRVDA
jgi:hypothetical protein